MNYTRRAVQELAQQHLEPIKKLNKKDDIGKVITDGTTLKLYTILMQLYGAREYANPYEAFQMFLNYLDAIDLDLLPQIVDISAHELMNFLIED